MQVRIITGFGLMDARAVLATCPSFVVTGLDQAGADRIRNALEAAGATVDIRPTHPR